MDDQKLFERNAYIKARSERDDEYNYFSRNIFDEGYEDPDAEPDEPVFTLDDLEAAKKESYNQGKSDGLKEATSREQNSREQFASQALNKIAAATTDLFAAEDARHKLYESESVLLTTTVFKKIFPVLDTLLGFDVLRSHIEAVLAKHRKTPTINIYVCPANVSYIQEFVNTLVTHGHNGVFNIYEDATLDDTSARLDWPQGGAYFSNAEIAEEIHSILERTLAEAGVTRHDDKGDDKNVDSMMSEEKPLDGDGNFEDSVSAAPSDKGAIKENKDE